jgi:hypothetical protein
MTTCRVCSSEAVRVFLDLGRVPLANSFLAEGHLNDDELRYPLGLQFCSNCTIVQIPETVDPDTLFRHYLYTPSASVTWREHCRELAEWVRRELGPRADPFVVEPASNDGCLLREIRSWAPRVLGVEPALNIAEQANRDGIPTTPQFFGEAVAKKIRADHGVADVVIGTNVLAHVPDLVDFLRGANALLDDDGMFVIEAPYLRDLVETIAYDTIYHEHVSYLSATALARALPLAGLALTHIERTPTHGGSIRFVGRKSGHLPNASVENFLEEEASAGYEDGSALVDFAARVDGLRAALADAVRRLVAEGRTLAAYGATAKGNTLLTTCEIDPSSIRYIVDRNPLKQGLYSPGAHIPVVEPERLDQDPVDVLLIFAWNITDEIIEQQASHRRRGGRFLVPIPEPRLI